MRRGILLTIALGCGGPGDAPPVIVPPVVPPPVVAPKTCADWSYAVTSQPFEPVQDISLDDLRAAWKDGRATARPDVAAALPQLGPMGTARVDAWTIVPAHELSPDRAVITVDGKHPLQGSLIGKACAPGVTPNIDPAHVTSIVMSGTTALTGRTAERIDSNGIADTIRFLKPFFTSADVVHVSNEVGFVKDCHPLTGQDKPHLKFCSRDRYIDLLSALHVSVVELTGSHLTDYGAHTLARTVDMYAAHNWQWYGGGKTQRDATAVKIVEDHGNRIGFVGCNAVNEWVHEISPGPGTAICDWPRVVWQIQDMRRHGIFPIVTVQHREVRTHAPPEDLVGDLRHLAEAGAGFVEGSQAHVAHPWDVHAGAYVHYGPGNTLFAQYREFQRDATIDKLWIYDGKLVNVTHLYVRTEHGQPRLLSTTERARYLAELATAEAEIAPPDPAPHTIPAAPREHPDSFVLRGRGERLKIVDPAKREDGVTYSLVLDLENTGIARDDAFVVTRRGRATATPAEVRAFMVAAYPTK
ncbi:MAG: CapA family protein [Kofleriaceae bacterium]